MIKGMSLQDILLNWLMSQIVVDQYPNDAAAKETCHEFLEVLQTDHQVDNLQYEKQETMYIVSYQQAEKQKQHQFPHELAEALLNSIHDKTLYVPGVDDQ